MTSVFHSRTINFKKHAHNIKQELYNEHTSPLKQPSLCALIARIASALTVSIIVPQLWQNLPPTYSTLL
jgi:hypothetical protein